MANKDEFSATEIETYKSLLNLSATDTIPDYEFFYEGNGFKSWRKLKGDTGLYMYRSIGVIPVPPEVYFKFYKDINFWKTWDENCEILELIETKEAADGGEDEFIYWSVSYPFPFSNRDYVYRRYSKKYEDQFWMLKSNIVTHPKRAKENGSRVRVLEYECVVAIGVTDKGETKLFLDSYEDAQIVIPTWALKWLTEKALPQFLNTLVEKCKQYKI